MRKRWIVGVGTVVVVLGLGSAALVFKPWLLFIDVEVNEALPIIQSPVASPEPTESSAPEPPAGPLQLSAGELLSHEHETSGTVRIIENPDGTRTLALENLSTSNGPDVHVWLSAAPVVAGYDGRFLAGDPAHVDLGLIKGNLGNQIYDIPADVDLGQFPSVYLWCEQFSVSFGAAALS
ncbi:MAG: DM13 domain-containing protein [Rhodoglobus sp.]